MKSDIRRLLRVLMVGFVASQLALTTIDVPAVSADGGFKVHYPPEPCWPPNSEIPYPNIPNVVFKCICPDNPPIKANCRWGVRMKTGGSNAQGFVLQSSTYGCLLAENSLVSRFLGATTNAGVGGVFGENYPCDYHSKKLQPAGEYRVQAVVEHWTGVIWEVTTPLGYSYNDTTARGITEGWDMGAVPDDGAGTYRLSNTAAIFEGGLWRGGTLWAPQVWMQP